MLRSLNSRERFQTLTDVAANLLSVLRPEADSNQARDGSKVDIPQAIELAELLVHGLRDTYTKGRNPLIPEVVEKIIEFALAPSFLLDSSLSSGPNSSWCQSLRSRKSYMNVCRTWYLAGRKFLYRDIAFRRPGQISALLRTLDDSEALSNYASFITSIEINCYIPRTWTDTLKSDLQAILDRCRDTLSTLKTRDAFWHGSEGAIDLDLHRQTALKVLDCQGNTSRPHFNPFNLFPYISIFSSTLESLFVESSKLPTEFEPTRFDRLRFLCLRGALTKEQAAFVDSWEMPNIVSLDCFDIPNSLRLLNVLGSRIEYLCIHSLLSIHSLASLCPDLKHFHLHLRILDQWRDEVLGSISHPKIQWLDMRLAEANDNPHTVEYRWNVVPGPLVESSMSNLPSLQNVRWFRPSTALTSELPLRIPPNTRDDFDLDYAGFRLIQHQHTISQIPASTNLLDLPDYEEEEATEEETPEVDIGDSEDFSEGSGSDAWETEGSSTSENGEQLDHEEILDLFTDTLQI